MGTQIINRFLFSFAILMFLSCFSSHTSIGTKEITDAKVVALCHCFKTLNIQTDSLSIMTKDVSVSYFTEYSTLSPAQILDIENFVEQNVDSFIGISREIGYNMIGFSCWRLYESKELDLFVKERINLRR